MDIRGYEIIGDWKNSQCGKIATATKGGKKYFVKMYQTPVNPVKNGSISQKTFARNKQKFEKFVAQRRAINTKLREVALEGGTIVIPREEFVYDNHYVEISEFVEGAVPSEEVEGLINSLPAETKKMLLLTATGALKTVHDRGIVHSDLKLKNILIAKNSSGNYVARLIDFDSSYLLTDKPAEIGGDFVFYSPELGRYSDCEDDAERAELAAALTEKSDIFSLGIIFHYYMSGEYPQPERLTPALQRRKDSGKKIYCWIAVNCGVKLAVSDKVDGAYRALIGDMLSPDPAARPSATEVLARLRNRAAERERPAARTEEARPEAPAGAPSISGKGVPRPEGFAALRAEDNAELNEEMVRSRGFVASCLNTEKGGYNFYRADSTPVFFTTEKLISMGYARRRTPETAAVCAPWEGGIKFNTARIRERGFVKVERSTKNGIKGYMFTRVNGVAQFIRHNMVVTLGYAAAE